MIFSETGLHFSESCSGSAVLARPPQDLHRAFVVGVAGGNKQIIGKPVDVLQYFGRDALVRLVHQLGDQPFGAPANGAGEMKIRSGRQAAGQDEGSKRLKLGIEPVDLAFEPRNLRGGDGQARPTWAFALAGRRKIGAGVEQIVLNACERRTERGVACGVQARDADGSVGLVKRSVGGDPQIIFLAPLAAAERGRAIVAGAGVDLVEDHHASPRQIIASSARRALLERDYFAITQMVNMMMTMATNCSTTRRRISFCEVLPEPPRIMLTRPSRRTMATAPMAIGTRPCDRKFAMQRYLERIVRGCNRMPRHSGRPESITTKARSQRAIPQAQGLWIPGSSLRSA